MKTTKRDWKFFRKLFTSTFFISAFTFGGGFVIIPLLRKKFVCEYKWIQENEMWDLMAIAQSSPGAIAVNASIIIGYRLAGIPGALVSILGTILPPFLILSVISVGYAAFRDSLIVAHVLKGMQAGVAAVITDVVIGMLIKTLGEKKALPIAVMLGAFAATYVFHVNVVYIILVCGVIGGVDVCVLQKYKKEVKAS